MELRPVSDLRIYIDNKAASMLTSLALNVGKGSDMVEGVITRQVVTKGGAFGGSMEEITEEVVLENWRDSVVRLRLKKPTSLFENQDGECEGPIDEEPCSELPSEDTEDPEEEDGGLM